MFFLKLKTSLLLLKGLLLTYKDALNVTTVFLKDVFGTATRVLLVRNKVLRFLFLVPRTQEHFETSTLNARHKCLTLFTFLCRLCAHS